MAPLCLAVLDRITLISKLMSVVPPSASLHPCGLSMLSGAGRPLKGTLHLLGPSSIAVVLCPAAA